tara:strand:+ start:66 stop:338 length:273 start_codon:yes stop_codon:yes gene_type:complete
MNTKNKIEKKLKEYFNVHTLQIIDESHKHINHKKDTQGGHFKLLIISEDFENISLIKRHQLIYDALSDMIKIDIHAISINAKTVKESHLQ